MSYLLDTNICIPLINDAPGPLRDRFLACAPDEVFLCSVVKAELLYGARKSERVSENLLKLERFFAPFDSLPFSDDAAARYGIVRAQLEQAGRPVGGNDLLIASIALATDLTLVTRNMREFNRIPGLRVELW